MFAAFTAEMQEKKFKFIQRKFPALESVALGIVIRKAAAIGVERTALKGGSSWKPALPAPALESMALGIVIRKAAAIGVERTALKGGSKWG